MALKPHSENPELGTPDDYQQHHPEEHPGMWGWHGEFGTRARIGAGVVTIAVLLLMITTTQYNHQGTMWLIIFSAVMAVMIGWDIHRSRNSWRR